MICSGGAVQGRLSCVRGFGGSVGCAPPELLPSTRIECAGHTWGFQSDWVTPYDLRRYYASLLIRSGVSVKVVQTRLGHAP